MKRRNISKVWLALVICLCGTFISPAYAAEKSNNKAERVFQKVLREVCRKGGSLKRTSKYLDAAMALDHPNAETIMLLHEARIMTLGESLAIPHEWCM